MPSYNVILLKYIATILTVLLSYSTHFVCATLSSSQWDSEIVENEGSLSSISYTHLFFALIGSVMIFLFLVVFLLPMCMDCMNSEVSSDTNPACGGSSGVSHYATNEVRVPASLPYSTTHHLQEGSGFIGYQTAGYPSPYAANVGARPSPAEGQFQRHCSPFDQEAPPPPYDATVLGNH